MRGGRIDSHGDHRIAMAFAVASLIASAPIEIEDVANVATSFPGFARLARAAGLALED
jgi:5-enolpyruvylshikimate-3-phosphate synthase